jgi:hypothetical protein
MDDLKDEKFRYVRINDNGVNFYVSKVVFDCMFNNDVIDFRSNHTMIKQSYSDYIVGKNGDLLKCRHDMVSILDRGLDVVAVV